MAEPTPWAAMDRGELIGRLSSITSMHDLEPAAAKDTMVPRHCRCCIEIHPCATRIVATGMVQ